MKKTLLASLTLTTLAFPALADEGMWMPQQATQIAAQLKAAGLKLDPANLTKLTEFPMGAIVSIPGCSASFVSPQGLIVTNHHCAYGSIAHNSRAGRNLLADGFLAKTLEDELPAAPGSRIWVTTDVSRVTDKIITADIAKLAGRARVKAIEDATKAMVADCEKDPGHRCTVAPYYGSLEYYRIKQLEIKDVRLVHAPPEGVGKFGGDTDNWMWPRHTGDYSFLRGYVSKDGKSAEFSKDNVPYAPKHWLRVSAKGVQEGDYVMVAGYPGRTNRHRLPTEIKHTFDVTYPAFVRNSADTLAIIARETKDSEDKRLKYASQVAGINNYYKNRQGMIELYRGSDMQERKEKDFAELKTWVNADAKRRADWAADLDAIETLIKQRDTQGRRDGVQASAMPRLVTTARTLLRLAHESAKPDAERKPGFQARDLPRLRATIGGLDRSYDEAVDKALVQHFLKQYLAQPAAERNATLDAALGFKDGMGDTEIKAVIDTLYAGSKLGNKAEREAWLGKKVDDFKASNDSFIKLAVALFDNSLAREADEEETAGRIQSAYASYMKAHIAWMNSKGRAVYPDANSTLRISFGKVAGRAVGADGTSWLPFTTVEGIVKKATGEGEFNAPKAQLEAIRAKNYAGFADAKLKTVPVNFLATLDTTGGNSGSAAMNAKGELVGLAFDGTLDAIISDWDFDKVKTRSIVADARYMLWQMKVVDKAENLIKEMGVQ